MITCPKNMRNTFQGLLKLDFDLSGRLQARAQKNGWRQWAKLIDHSGDSWVWAIGLGLIWLFSRGELHRYVAILEISVVLQALLVFALKGLIRRRRPSGEGGAIYRQFDPHSFPSGHATRAILLVVLAVALGPAWFAWLMLAWAPFVCLSRVLTGLHYLSDILGGVALGLVLGLIMVAVSPWWIAWFPFLF